MKSDTQFYQIIRACPELIYELAGLPNPGPCRTLSETFKEFSRSADAVIEPLDESLPVCVVEVQHQLDGSIYNRLVIERALAQQQRNYRPIQGVILFAGRELDPSTEPWTKLIQPLYLDEVVDRLRETQPDHLLLDVLAPTYLQTDTELEQWAPFHYHRLRSRNLPTEVLQPLLAVFESWIFHLIKTQDRETFAMKLNIPTGDIRETVVGRELIDEGIRRGMERGLQLGSEQGLETGMERSLLKLGRKHFGPIPPALEARIQALDLAGTEALFDAMLDMGSWEDVTKWLDAQA
ncbi:MAG: DUF2887 domain-containing protein [Prosthecobacter sp.]|nr:DUF2887 domain-containing protein [Prosthecobacter sp.]